jgi:hypothetical protein
MIAGVRVSALSRRRGNENERVCTLQSVDLLKTKTAVRLGVG